MKTPLLTIAIVLCSLICHAQVQDDEEVPDFGKIDKRDLLLSSCSFDKEATAYRLLALGNVDYKLVNGGFCIRNNRRIRIKVLTEKGIDKRKVSIIFSNNMGTKAITGLAGNTYNLEGNDIITSPLKPDSVKFKKISNRFSEVSFTMPDVKAGSVFEYEVTYLNKSIANLEDWYFQDDIPTRYSEYALSVPQMFRFAVDTHLSQEVEQQDDIVNLTATHKKEKLDYASISNVYVLRNVPALKHEAFENNYKDYLQRISFRLVQVDYGNGEKENVEITWDALTKELLADPDFGQQLEKKLSHTGKLDNELSSEKEAVKKMEIIRRYVSDYIKWNGENSLYASRGVNYSWDKKTGNSAEMNFILINLLKDAGLTACPVLVSTNDNSDVNTTYPVLKQFNTIMTAVEVEGKQYILNAADRYTPVSLVPENVLNKNVFIVDAQHSGWKKLTYTSGSYRDEVKITASLLPDNVLTGNVQLSSREYAKIPELERIKEQHDTLGNVFTKMYEGLKIDSIAYSGMDQDTSALEQSFDFSMPLNSSARTRKFSLNFFRDIAQNPFTDTTRSTDIVFHFPRSCTISGEISIPAGYQFEKLPGNISIGNADSVMKMTREIRTGKNKISFRITFDISQSTCQIKDYAAFRKAYAAISEALSEEVVVKSL